MLKMNPRIWFNIFVIFVVTLTPRASYSKLDRSVNVWSGSLFSLFQKVPRLLTFNTLDDNVKIDMQLTVPFLDVPIQNKSSTTSMSPRSRSVNVNMAAIVLSGIMVLAGISLSAGFSLLNKTAKSSLFPDQFHKRERYSKNDDVIWDALNSVDDALKEYNINLTPCIHMRTCLLVNKSSKNVIKRTATSADKIIDGLTSIPWILQVMQGTATIDAITAGRHGEDCYSKYVECI